VRTKAALAGVKARGKVLGNPNLAAARAESKSKKRRIDNAALVLPHILPLRD
jgi:hypothetical protein